MSNSLRRTAAAIIIGAAMSSMTGAASALPVGALAIRSSVPAAVETVQWRRGWGWGIGAGFLAGAIVGSALTAPYYYGYGPYPYYAAPPGPVYYGAPAPAYGPPAPGYGAPAAGPASGYGEPAAEDAVAYCAQQFRSYDPRSGTYLGYDGQRHPCP